MGRRVTAALDPAAEESRPAGVLRGWNAAFLKTNKEETWDFNKVAVLAGVREKCTRRIARIAKRNAKFLSSRAWIVPFIARSVLRNARKAAVNRTPSLPAASHRP